MGLPDIRVSHISARVMQIADVLVKSKTMGTNPRSQDLLIVLQELRQICPLGDNVSLRKPFSLIGRKERQGMGSNEFVYRVGKAVGVNFGAGDFILPQR